MKCLSVLIISISSQILFSQGLDSSSFDFWIGSWDLTWYDKQGAVHKGSNHIEKILEGKVIQENFADSTGGFYGKSWSTFNPATGRWNQVWTDNRSAFLQFEGERHGDTLAFVMSSQIMKDKAVIRRMIFYNIKKDRFTWEWQSSVGNSGWNSLWKIEYIRKG